MGKILFTKLKESLISVLPVAAIVLIISFTPLVNLTTTELVAFIVSAVFLILGIGLFNLGADLAMTPMGEHIGSGLTKSKSMKVLLIVCFIMGVMVTVAEPDLSVLASQVKGVINGTALIVTVGAGVGLFLLLAILKIIFKKNLSTMLMFFYMLLFALTSIVVINGNGNFLPLAFDSGGVTTGPITVPFIMALGVGVAATIGGRHSNENSFGLIAMCSVGPVLAVMIFGIFSKGAPSVNPSYSIEDKLGIGFGYEVLNVMKDVAIALGLVVIFFFIINFIFLKLPKRKLIQIIIGIAYTFFGLVIFLTAVNVGFMPVGYKIGTELGKIHSAAITAFGFVIGLVVVLAEPAVHVLNKQVESITNGTVSKLSMMIALSVGVGISLALSIIRIIFEFNILYYLIPGYFISLGLSFFVPRMYTAIAFDSGGVASGPLTSSFILPLCIGVCQTLGGNVLSDAFGIVAMVAMTPLITIQLLGFKAVMTAKVREKLALKRILDKDDEQIIDFM